MHNQHLPLYLCISSLVFRIGFAVSTVWVHQVFILKSKCVSCVVMYFFSFYLGFLLIFWLFIVSSSRRQSDKACTTTKMLSANMQIYMYYRGHTIQLFKNTKKNYVAPFIPKDPKLFQKSLNICWIIQHTSKILATVVQRTVAFKRWKIVFKKTDTKDDKHPGQMTLKSSHCF